MELAAQATAIKKRFKNMVIGGVLITRTDVLIEQEGKRQSISFAQLIGKSLTDITCNSSTALRKIDVSGWLNDGKSVEETSEPKVVDLNEFVGETIVSVGFYHGKLNGKQRVTLSLETKRDPSNSKARSKTIAFGMYVK